jgi:hypothetical protein
MSKPNTQQVSRAGEHFVAAELHRRGAYAVTFAGNMPRIDILATNSEQTRTAAIQVKTMTAGAWQTSITRGREREEPTEEDTHFWIFVELKEPPAQPDFYVVPEWWIENDIHRAHGEYLGKHGGQRAMTKDSTHHAIKRSRIEQWRGRWDLLGLFTQG